MNGCGGFIDISQTVHTIVFQVRWLSGSTIVNNKVTVKQEGHTSKFVNNIGNTDFNAHNALELKQEVYFVTERAVLY